MVLPAAPNGPAAGVAALLSSASGDGSASPPSPPPPRLACICQRWSLASAGHCGLGLLVCVRELRRRVQTGAVVARIAAPRVPFSCSARPLTRALAVREHTHKRTPGNARGGRASNARRWGTAVRAGASWSSAGNCPRRRGATRGRHGSGRRSIHNHERHGRPREDEGAPSCPARMRSCRRVRDGQPVATRRGFSTGPGMSAPSHACPAPQAERAQADARSWIKEALDHSELTSEKQQAGYVKVSSCTAASLLAGPASRTARVP